MATEQDRTLAALQTALQMEIDGKEYYLRLSRESTNKLGKKLLQSLAAEEDIHHRKFEEIYDVIRSRKAWPLTDFQPDGGKRLRTIFAIVTEAMDFNVKTHASELDAIQIAIDMENKTCDFYKGESRNAIHDAERDFYQALAGEEREHYLILTDYRKFLEDPMGWFVAKEHRLDAG